MNFLAWLMFLLAVGLGYCSNSSRADDCKVDKVVFCYYASWSVYRPPHGALQPEAISPNLCTHLIYSFAGISIEGFLKSLDPALDLITGKDAYRRFTNLKERNPCLKTLLAVGGWNELPEKFSIMAENAENRSRFISTIVRFLVEFGFDGLDVDWEYPTQRGGIPEDKKNFVLLLQELRAALTPRNRMLTVAVGATESIIDQAYDIPAICNTVDFVNLMAYEYQLSDVTSMLAPLKEEVGETLPGTVDGSVRKWINGGCAKEKLVLGIPTIARTFTLDAPNENPALNGLGLPSSAPGTAGDYTQTAGFFSYLEICLLVEEDDGWHVVHKERNANKYATFEDQWITYDDPETAATKTEYALEMGLGGLMVWSIDTDDFNSFCGVQQKFGILLAINNAIKNSYNKNYYK